MINVVKHEVNEKMSDMQGQGNLLISRVGEVWVYIAKHGVNEGSQQAWANGSHMGRIRALCPNWTHVGPI